MTVIHPNILKLKRLLIIKNNKKYINRDISQGAQISYNTIGNLIRGNITLLYLSTLSKLVRYFQREGLTVELGDFFCWQGEELVLNVGPLISRLDSVPTNEEIAQDTGIPLLRVENLVKGNVKRVCLADLAALLGFFRQRGIEIELGDLLREEEPIVDEVLHLQDGKVREGPFH